jgi:hypothetical protein
VTEAQESETPTVFDRLIAAGISQQRAEWYLGAGRIELDGEVVTDPYQPAPRPSRLVIVAA